MTCVCIPIIDLPTCTARKICRAMGPEEVEMGVKDREGGNNEQTAAENTVSYYAVDRIITGMGDGVQGKPIFNSSGANTNGTGTPLPVKQPSKKHSRHNPPSGMHDDKSRSPQLVNGDVEHARRKSTIAQLTEQTREQTWQDDEDHEGDEAQGEKSSIHGCEHWYYAFQRGYVNTMLQATEQEQVYSVTGSETVVWGGDDDARSNYP